MNLKTIMMMTLLMSNIQLAGQIVDVTLTIFENGTIEPYNVAIYNGTPSRFQDKEGIHTLRLLDKTNNTLDITGYGEFSFWLLSDPPLKIDRIPLVGSLEYSPKAYAVGFYNRSTPLFYQVLPQNKTCQRDGVCQSNEDTISCPYDCNISNDRVCTPFSDGICDPACTAGLDPDCNTTPTPSPISRISPQVDFSKIAALLFGVTFIAIGVYWIWRTRKNKQQ